MRSFRQELLALVVVIGTLSSLAAIRGSVHGDNQTPQSPSPRVTVDGVSVGDSPETVKGRWGACKDEPFFGEMFLEPKRQPAPHGIELFGRRYAQARGAYITDVQGQSLIIDGRIIVRVGDSMEKVRELFGESEHLVLKAGCGNPGPAESWTYRRHGVILCFVVPNQDFWRKDFETQLKAHPGAKASFDDIIRKEPLLHEVQGISIHLRSLE